jgi:hypothetical protein
MVKQILDKWWFAILENSFYTLNKYWEDFIKLHLFVERYSKFIYKSLKNINYSMIETLKIMNKYDNKNRHRNINNIKTINENIRGLFWSNVWKFKLDDLITFYFIENTKIESDYEEVFIKINLYSLFSNIILNTSEHAFWDDFKWWDKKITSNWYFTHNWYYIVEITDNWRWITKEELKNVFVEWETIKEKKEWHWIAMAVYKKQMQGLWWDINVYSEWLWKWTTFEVIIPKSIIINE